MAKGKYEYWLTAEGLLQLGAWARNGLTDEQLADKMHISTSTLYEWKKKYSEISESLKKNKEVVDIQVENALLKRALGFTYTETTRERELNEETGEFELVTTKTVEKIIVPDTTAQIFWLKNRKPDEWRDKRTVDTNNDIASNLLEVIANGMKEDINTDDIQELQQTANAGADVVEQT